MKPWVQHPIRFAGRLLWFAGEVALAAWGFAIRCGLNSKGRTLAVRAACLQHYSRRVLRVFGVFPGTFGPVPSSGLLICNHLSYLDVLVLSAITPAVFVSKLEVKSWPLFGWFARMAGTVFVHREKRGDVAHTTDEIQNALGQGALVVLFPEGTSSDGRTVLPFKTSLLEPAVGQTHSLTVGLISYEIDDGDVGEEVCYWKDMTLLPHLLNLLGKRTLRASVRFSRLEHAGANRKELARKLHAEVMSLKCVAAPAAKVDLRQEEAVPAW